MVTTRNDVRRQTDVPDLIPARMLNEFCYCPRLAYLEWVQGEFADNLETQAVAPLKPWAPVNRINPLA